jgi:hypothetical protein
VIGLQATRGHARLNEVASGEATRLHTVCGEHTLSGEHGSIKAGEVVVRAT